MHTDGSGYPAFNRLKRDGLVPGPKAIVRTPGGGMHLFYAGTEQRNGHLPGQHLDYRAQGGYVVAPPSTAGGRPYEVVRHQPSAATFDWTAAREHLEPRQERQDRQRREPDGVHLASPDRLTRWVAGQREGNRNDGLFYAANRVLDAGRGDMLDGLARAARHAGLADREIDRTIRSAQQTAARGAQQETTREPQRGQATAGEASTRPFEHHPERDRELEAG